MATDATGTPTSLGIPKYNTSADAPSGLGFNAAMDAIDALIAARVAKPSGIAVGETPVWNGTGWDRSSVTKLSASGVSGLVSLSTGTTISAANTDLALPSASAVETFIELGVTGTAGTIRSLGAGTPGQVVVLRHAGGAATSFVVKHALAGGTGSQFWISSTTTDAVLQSGDTITLIYDNSGGTPLWVEVSRSITSWQPYAVQWNNAGTANTLGNGTLTGRYIQIGKTVFYKIFLTWGSTTVSGSSWWQFTVPVAATAAAGDTSFGNALDSSAASRQGAWSRLETTAYMSVWSMTPVNSLFGASTPFVWATGDTLILNGSYEAA